MPEIVINDYGDKCGRFGSLFVGATGGAALGYWTKIFDRSSKVDQLTIEMKSDALKQNKYFQQLQKLQLGGNYQWRIGGQVLSSIILYSFLECKFQGGWPRRSMVDCALAGAITGGALGLRGLPGGKTGAIMGAGGFALYASIIHILFR